MTDDNAHEVPLHPVDWFDLVVMTVITLYGAYDGHSWLAAIFGCCTGMGLAEAAQNARARAQQSGQEKRS